MESTRKKVIPAPIRRNALAPSPPALGPADGSELLGQARRWARVARDAYRSAARGAEAELELQRRQNASGQ